MVMCIDHGWDQPYHILLTTEQRACARALAKALNTGETSQFIENCIHDLSYSLFCHVPKDRHADKYYSVVNRFILLESIQPNAEFKRAGQISQTISAMMYCVRTTMLNQTEKIMELQDVSIVQ